VVNTESHSSSLPLEPTGPTDLNKVTQDKVEVGSKAPSLNDAIWNYHHQESDKGVSFLSAGDKTFEEFQDFKKEIAKERGPFSRSMMHFITEYPGNFSSEPDAVKKLVAWHKEYPASQNEINIHESRSLEMGGKRNRFVDDPNLAEQYFFA
jgi:endonuclease I